MNERSPVLVLAVVGVLAVVLVSTCGAAFSLATGDALSRFRLAEDALQSLEDTARQGGAAVCAGVVVSRSCNVSQVQEKAPAPEGWGPAAPFDYWWTLILLAGVVVILVFYILLAEAERKGVER